MDAGASHTSLRPIWKLSLGIRRLAGKWIMSTRGVAKDWQKWAMPLRVGMYLSQRGHWRHAEG